MNSFGTVRRDKELVARCCDAMEAELRRLMPRGIDAHQAADALMMLTASIAVRAGVTMTDVDKVVAALSALLREDIKLGIEVMRERQR
jgi:hypothetical protein